MLGSGRMSMRRRFRFGVLVAVQIVALACGGWGPAVVAQEPASEVQYTISIEPSAPFFGDAAQLTVAVQAVGGPITGLAVEMSIDCDFRPVTFTEVAGNSDAVLDPGELWQYTCDIPFVFHGVTSVAVTAVDDAGGPIAESSFLRYGAPVPVQIGVEPSEEQVVEGGEVIWETVVGNAGSYRLLNVDARIRILDGVSTGPFPYIPLGDPVETTGNGDDILDPGEHWTYRYASTITRLSWANVSVVVDPEHSPGTHFGDGAESRTVAVIPRTPPTTPLFPPPSPRGPHPFVDLPLWWAELGASVQWAWDASVTTGVDATHFAPDRTATRAEAGVVLHRAVGSPHGSPHHGFVDVARDWQQVAVRWLRATGVTTGVDATHFAPDRAITRGELGVMMWRMAGSPLGWPPHPFVDVTAPWQQEAIRWLKELGITTGVDPTHFAPDRPITRAELVIMLYRWVVAVR